MQLTSTLIGLFAAATTVTCFQFKLVNKAGADIYVYSTNHLGTNTPEVKLANGATYVSPHTLNNDGEGAAWEPHQNPYKPNYEIECSKKDGVLWYNFSPVEGAVFNSIARTLGGGPCMVKHCDAGSTSCDWFPEANGGDGNIARCEPIPAELVATLGA